MPKVSQFRGQGTKNKFRAFKRFFWNSHKRTTYFSSSLLSFFRRALTGLYADIVFHTDERSSCFTAAK